MVTLKAMGIFVSDNSTHDPDYEPDPTTGTEEGIKEVIGSTVEEIEKSLSKKTMKIIE